MINNANGNNVNIVVGNGLDLPGIPLVHIPEANNFNRIPP